MVKPSLLSGISLDDIDVELAESTLKSVAKKLEESKPMAHKAFHSVEGDVEKTGKALIDWFAGDDETDESPDIFAKLLNG
jgi:hypothetical protein